jgi:hypothetical protein
MIFLPLLAIGVVAGVVLLIGVVIAVVYAQREERGRK